MKSVTPSSDLRTFHCFLNNLSSHYGYKSLCSMFFASLSTSSPTVRCPPYSDLLDCFRAWMWNYLHDLLALAWGRTHFHMWAAPCHITATHSRSLYLLLNTLSLAFPDLRWQPGSLCYFVLVIPCSSLSYPPSYVTISFIWSIFYLLSSMVRSIGEEMALPLWYCLYLFPIAARMIVMNLLVHQRKPILADFSTLEVSNQYH